MEWGNLYVIGAVCATLFLGGWQVPQFTDNGFVIAVAQCLSFFVKTYFLVFLCMWIRGTLPRVRVDQLMTLCWKYLVPMTFVNLLCAMLYFVLFPEGNLLVSLTMFGLGVGVLLYFIRRVAFHLQRAKPEIHISPFI